MANKHNSTPHSREYIINTLWGDFDGRIDDEIIEASLIKLGLISIVTKSWLKEHYIDKQLAAKECAELLGCSLGHIQGCIKKYKLNKKKFGITTGNNQAHRKKLWKQKIQNSQPHRKEVVVFLIQNDWPHFEFPSIADAARKLNLAREHIRDCLNPNKTRKTVGKYRFMLKKAWDEHKLFLKKNEPTITANTSHEDMIAIAKADMHGDSKNIGYIRGFKKDSNGKQ